MPISITTPGGGSSAASGAPTDADYVVETAQSGLSAEVVLGTTAVTTTAFASRQAAAKAGRLHLPTNAPLLGRDTGAAWETWGPITKLTPPSSTSGWSWVNQGSATINTTDYGGWYLESDAATTLNRIYIKTAPATPYTITIAMRWNSSGYTDSPNAGILFRQSSDGKLQTFGCWQNTTALGQISSTKWTVPATFSAHYQTRSLPAWMYSTSMTWLRIADDGTNRICSASSDGRVWLPHHTVGRTDFLTADQIGIYVSNNGIAYTVGMHVLHYAEA